MSISVENGHAPVNDPFKERSVSGASTPHTPLTTPAVGGGIGMAAPTLQESQGKSPAFQFYPKDFITGTIGLTPEEVGAYIRLLCHQWEKGSVPGEIELIARIVGLPVSRMRRVWYRLLAYFVPDPANPAYGFVNARLERERRKQDEFRKRASDSGKRGGRPKKLLPFDGARTTRPDDGVEPEKGLERVPFPNPFENEKGLESSAICDLQTADTNTSVGAPAAEEIGDRARALIEWYAEVYPQFRSGVPYRRQDALDFPTACSLCATWSDERLHLMAEIFLRTDHKFAAEGRRSIRQFAALAEWCDSRLREHGR